MKNINLLFFVFFLASSIFITKIYAFDAPRIYIKEININKISFKAGDGVSGDFLMWNTAKEIMPDLDYKISLLQYHKVYGEEINHVSGQISPDQKLRQEFSYHIPQNIPTGDYKLRVQLFSQSGMALNWSDKDIKIKGSAGKYLVIGGSSVVKDGKSNPPLAGIGFKMNEVPKIKFLALNTSSQEVKLKPSVAVYWFQTNLNKTDEFFGESQTLAANESKEIELVMPKYQKPGSYLADVVLLSNNIDVSNTEKFRWVVKGEGARILNIKLDNDLLKAGEKAEIIVEFVGSADAMDRGEAILAINVFDNSGKNSFSQERKVKLSDDILTEIFSFIPTNYIANPRIEAKIIKNGKELTSYTSQIKTPGVDSNTEKIEKVSPINQNYFLTLIIPIVLFIIIFVITIIFFKKKLFLLVVLISAGLFFSAAGKIQAATVTWVEPVKDTSYNFGDTINFKGDLVIGGCDNGIDFKATAYVCDKDIANCFELGNKYNMNIDMSDIAYDSARKMIYIPDTEGQRILKINDNPASSNYKQIEKAWGSLGSGTGQFEGPRGIFYDSGDDLIYVADSYNNRIVRFEPDDPTAVPSGVWSTWRAYNNAGDSFNDPRGVFVDNKGSKTTVYVADYGHNRVVRFGVDNSGNMIAGSWKTFSSGFSEPYGIFYDSGPGANYSRFIYVTDGGNERVVRFKMDKDGALVGGSLKKYETSVSGKTLNGPIRARLYQGWVYVAEGSSRVTRFNPDDATQDWQTFGTVGSGPGEFQSVYGVAYDETSESSGPRSGFFYAASDYDKSIKKFKLDGAGNIILSTWENFDLFGTDGYDITYNLPADEASLPPGFKFANGTTDIDPKYGGIAPARSAFAKLRYEVIDTDPNDGVDYTETVESSERIVLEIPPPTYSISGNVFVDANKNKVKDGGETNYTVVAPTITIDYAGATINALADGTYTILNLSAGTYTVSYASVPTGYFMIWPSPPNLQVTVGSSPPCNVVDPLTGGSCAGDNVINLNFAISNSMPWIQTYGLDLRFDGGFTNRQPSSTTVDTNCGGGSFASGTSGTFNSPGIVFSGDGSALFGQGLPSNTDRVAGGMSYPEVFESTKPLKTSTQNLLAAADKAGITKTPLESLPGNNCNNPSISCNLAPMQKGFYYTSSNITIDNSKNFTGGNYVIVSDGTITITNGKTISVSPGSTVIFSARDIIIDKSIGAAANCSPLPVSQLQGTFSADHDIIVKGNNGVCTAGSDKMLNIEGIIIVNAARGNPAGIFDNQRDLCGDNPTYPSLTIKARPDFLLHIPGFLTEQNNISYEEEP